MYSCIGAKIEIQFDSLTECFIFFFSFVRHLECVQGFLCVCSSDVHIRSFCSAFLSSSSVSSYCMCTVWHLIWYKWLNRFSIAFNSAEIGSQRSMQWNRFNRIKCMKPNRPYLVFYLFGIINRNSNVRAELRTRSWMNRRLRSEWKRSRVSMVVGSHRSILSPAKCLLNPTFDHDRRHSFIKLLLAWLSIGRSGAKECRSESRATADGDAAHQIISDSQISHAYWFLSGARQIEKAIAKTVISATFSC